jgi:hypothetical protein
MIKKTAYLIRLIIISVILLLESGQSYGQSIIKGDVKDLNGNPIAFAAVMIKNSSDGTYTDNSGLFNLKTKLTGEQILLVSFIGYDQLIYPLKLDNKEYQLNLILKESSTMLNEVVISAGTIEARNDRVVAVLKPIDIVTSAGGQGDIAGAIQTLPGVQRNGGDQTGLMVRGGDVNESMVIIDGTTVQNAFGSNIPGVSQRSRFSPFQFKGTSFSSGGYSARYGQALSSVLELQTNDLPEKSNLNLGVNFSGAALSGAKLIDNNAIEYSANYTNLAPYYAITKTNFGFYNVPQGGGFSTRWVSKITDKGIFKMNFQQNSANTGITIPDPQIAGNLINFGLKNENTFYNTSFSYWTSEKLKYFTAFSFSNNTDKIDWGAINVFRHDSRVQGRGELLYEVNKNLKLLTGIEIQHLSYQKQYDTLYSKFDETLSVVYAESEWKPAKFFGIKAGVRAEHSALLNKNNITPRLSAAVKTSEHAQISSAAGIFYQSVTPNYLLEGYKPDFQKAIHYMINYQWMRDDRTFRVESYYKGYQQLVRENGIAYNPNQYRYNFGIVDNSGNGYAKGIDVFWRDQKSIKNLDYWISYSYIDTKRLYQNYLSKATPDYISPNNLNIIVKYYIENIQTNISASYYYASGRSYYNPNTTAFLSDKAPDYHNLALNLSYLTTIKNWFTVIYLSIDNLTNNHNVLGYRYSNDGTIRYPIVPPTFRSIFFGINISLTKYNKDEL